MGLDLKLIHDLWQAAKQEYRDEWRVLAGGIGRDAVAESERLLVPYLAILFVGRALLKDRALAQRFVDETWEGLDDDG